MQSRVLRERIERTPIPSPEGVADFAIVAPVGVGYLARARSGAATYLIPLSTAPSGVGRRGGGFSLNPAARVLFTHEGNSWEQAAATLECTDLQFLDAYLVLVLDLAQRLGTVAPEPRWAHVLEWLEQWQSLLGRRVGLTPEQQLGLFGELWFIHRSTDVDLLIAGWRGPDRDAVDFLLDGIGLEVKTSRRPHIHHISMSQVDRPLGDYPTYILSLWVAPDPVRGLALQELVDRLLAAVADPARFLRQVATIGYSPQDHDQYQTRYAVVEEPLWFTSSSVPCIRDVDEGVSQVRYVVTLNPEKSISPSSACELNRHFRHDSCKEQGAV